MRAFRQAKKGPACLPHCSSRTAAACFARLSRCARLAILQRLPRAGVTAARRRTSNPRARQTKGTSVSTNEAPRCVVDPDRCPGESVPKRRCVPPPCLIEGLACYPLSLEGPRRPRSAPRELTLTEFRSSQPSFLLSLRVYAPRRWGKALEVACSQCSSRPGIAALGSRVCGR